MGTPRIEPTSLAADCPYRIYGTPMARDLVRCKQHSGKCGRLPYTHRCIE